MMGKPPLMGKVKTRLSRDIGPARAVSFYRHAVHRLLWRLGRDPRWQARLAVNAPNWSGYASWPDHIKTMPQGEGDLGDRMAFVFDALPPGPALIIGTDSPQIEPRHIARAFDELDRHDAVFGPSDDGGYWLVGLARRRPAPDLFRSVRWSTEYALKDTVESLPASFTVGQIETLIDVDTGEDFDAFVGQYGPLCRGPWRRRA